MKRYKCKIQEADRFLGKSKTIKGNADFVSPNYIYLNGDLQDLLYDWLEEGIPIIYRDINGDVVVAKNKEAYKKAQKIENETELM